MDIAPLDRRDVTRILEALRENCGQTMGVTLQEDDNGAWGRAGARYLTVRFNSPSRKNDTVEVHMEIISVRSSAADWAEHEQQTADK